MSMPPTGTVTFLFTDIEGSTERWDRHPDAMRDALERHDALIRRAVETHSGHVFKTVGDAFCAAFATARQGLAAALDAQLALAAEDWSAFASDAGDFAPLAVRMGLHTGAAEERAGDYFGPPLNRCARLQAAGHGGQVLVSLATQQLLRDRLPAELSLRDLGEHRLKDLRHTEHIFQLVAPGLLDVNRPLATAERLQGGERDTRTSEAEAQRVPDLLEALRKAMLEEAAASQAQATTRAKADHTAGATAPPAYRLPAPTSRFFGRARELEQLGEALDASRLLTLTGIAGVGKTRLALELARTLESRFEDGACFVDLSALEDPSLIPQSILDAIDVEPAPGGASEAELEAGLADLALLLVLDNCEHLLEAMAELTSGLLAAAPRLHMMVTSRSPLALPGEVVWRLAPLALPTAEGSLDPVHAGAIESIALFVDRARAGRQGFELTAANTEAVAAICRRLDGIALAIELAAARVRMLSPEQILQRLDDRFALLTGLRRGAGSPHHQTLQAALEWSYHMLEPVEQRLLRQVSVFRGGWTIEAAEAVADPEGSSGADILDRLGRLVDMSLVETEDRGAAMRFHCLETVRAFAGQALRAEGEELEARSRHARWHLALAEEARRALEGSDQTLWLRTVAIEMQNLRAAADWLESSAGQARLALALATDLHGYWQMLGHLGEGLRRLRRALDFPENTEPSPERARALVGAGELAFRMGELQMARDFLGESIELWRAAADLEGEAQALRRLGNLLDVQGDYAAAQRALEQALAIWQQLDDGWGIAATRNNLSLVARKQGRLEDAREQLQRSLARFEQLGTDWAIAVTHANLGDIALDRYRLEDATSHYQASLHIAEALEDVEGEAYALEGLANVLRHQGEHALAWQLLARSLRGLLQIEARLEIADWLESALQLALAEDRHRLAARLLGATDGLRADMDTPTPSSTASALAEAEHAMGAALGEEDLATVRAEGREIGWRQLVDTLLTSIDEAEPPPAPGTTS